MFVVFSLVFVVFLRDFLRYFCWVFFGFRLDFGSCFFLGGEGVFVFNFSIVFFLFRVCLFSIVFFDFVLFFSFFEEYFNISFFWLKGVLKVFWEVLFLEVSFKVCFCCSCLFLNNKG